MWITSLLAIALTVVPGVWPLDPRPEVVEDFAPPAQRWEAGHRGVDLLGEQDQPVRAAVAGRITYAGLIAGRGVVVVGHGDTRTTYEPVAAVVRVGDLVSAGQRIGTLESGGSHCPPRVCLHWGLLRGETYLDPLTLVGAGPVRLLPLFSADPPPPSAQSWWPELRQPELRQAVLPGVMPVDGPVGRPGVAGPW